MLKRALFLASVALISGSVSASSLLDRIMARSATEDGVREVAPIGSTVEQYQTTEETFLPWALSDGKDGEAGDRIETREVTEQQVDTVKLQGLVPPILFESGEADIPDEYIEQLRGVLDSMRDRVNVRLHFVGHTDNVPLSAALQVIYEDNVGLSRERAGTTAEYFQQALGLPPESISYEGMGESRPVAGNDTAAGRARNRRVEVEVWYDEIGEKTVEREVIVAQEMNRIKICRVETVCKLSYKEGHANRAQIRNVLAPLLYDEQNLEIPPVFLEQLQEALQNLGGKQNVVIRFIGHTDNLPLHGRDERIYGTSLSLSRARAHRVALAVQEALGLSSMSIESDGRGASRPVASNDTEQGRRLNRRIEVEFWYDDPLQALPDEPQICPEHVGAETVTRVYDPPSGAIEPIYYNGTSPVIPPGYSQRLQRLMGELEGRANVRLRLIGYTSNERLDRRTANVYGDDIGLSTARARRVMDTIREEIGLEEHQAEHEGRGYVQSDDVVNSGFVESDVSRVVVQVVYDELAILDEREGLDIARLTREVDTRNPYSLNLMRITVDGRPIDDPNKGVPDVQRCTDVALDRASIQFRFDNLDFKPRLNVSAWPTTLRYRNDPATEYADNAVRFRMYSNYRAFFEQAEIRIFENEQSVRDEPLAVVAVNADGFAEWEAEFDDYRAPGKVIKYVLRVYNEEGLFDETREQQLWVVDQIDVEQYETADVERELLVGYGENRVAVQNIPLNGGAIKVYGEAIPRGYSVWLAGRPVPLGGENNFVAEELLPAGLHSVEVAVLDPQGNGELFLRDLELKKSDWFYVGIADLTVARDDTTGPAKLVTQQESPYDNSVSVDGRVAFYLDGKFGEDWRLTASADTREGPVEDLFTNFMDKSPDAVFRRMDPEYHYPTFGDDSTMEEGAPTMGKFYARLQRHENYGLWGNFKIGYTDNTLAHVDRSLYGANVHLQSRETTSFGEQRIHFDSFAAEPGTVASRQEFRGTGGSLYYLRHQDILMGSERLRIEIRDSDSNMVVGVKNLVPGLDYDIDYIQGRILLTEPLSASVPDDMLVDSGGSGGNLAYLVARYEYTPGFNDIDTLSLGGRGHYWFGDHVKLGLTASHNDEEGAESSLGAADLTLRRSAATWLKIETSQSEGDTVDTFGSFDGGYSFDTAAPLVGSDSRAAAHRLDGSLALDDVFENLPGRVTLYHQQLEAGYSAPGLVTLTDTTQQGGTVTMPVGERIQMRMKADRKSQDQGLETTAAAADVDYRLNDHWTVSSGVRVDEREDNSPVVPLTQEEGRRTDMRLQAGYDSRANWNAYGFVQDTLSTTGNRDENARVGTGGSYRVTDRFRMHGEVSGGDLGSAGRLGTEYLYSDRTNLYMNYALENERTDNGLRARRGNMNTGFRTRFSDSASMYMEERYTHGDVPTGLTHATGVDLAPSDRWNYGAHVDFGTLKDPDTAARTDRQAMGLRVGYGHAALSFASALEYRVDKREFPSDATREERTTWLLRNSLKYQINPDWRLLGKYNHADSSSSLGDFFDGNFIEASIGSAYRPVDYDRLNALFKYTYFYNLPSADQVTITNSPAQYVQKSHILSVDTLYDLTHRWSVGGKYAYRHGQLSMDRVDPEFFDSRAHLYVLRADWHFTHRWDALIEWRLLDLVDAEETRDGWLVGIYRHVGRNLKLGAGYNFSSFSDDLTDLDYKTQGLFINVVGKI
jgi:flagellar motor protein MotB